MPRRQTVRRPAAPPNLVLVGSRNPPKVAAVREAFSEYFPGVQVRGIAADPGVADQPIGWPAIVKGAKNRARQAFRAARCDLGVGYEDGLVKMPATRTGYANFGCCAIYDGRRFAVGFSAGFEYPLACTREALTKGTPVGDTFDKVFAGATGGTRRRGTHSSLTIGNVGMLTGRKLTRRAYTRQAVIAALIALRHPQLFE